MKYLKGLILVFVLIIVTFIIYNFVSICILKQNYVNYFGYTYFNVGSGSMHPTIESDDIVIVKMGEVYKLNDIVTFPFQNSFITHRVVEIRDNVLITRGDANYIKDVPVNSDDVIGKVVFIWKKGGIVRKVLLAPRVLITFVITLFLIAITYSYDKDLFKKYRMRRLSKKKIREYKREIREKKKKEKLRKDKSKKTKVVSKKRG